MLTSILALLFLLLLCAGLSGLSGRSAEACIPLSFCLTIAWLFFFYCMQLVRLGLVLYCLLSAGMFLSACFRAKRANILLRRVFTPGFVAYLCICGLFVALFSQNRVCMVDELRLWGAVPKAIHALGTLQLGDSSPILSVMQSYTPGFPLLGFYFTAFSPEFQEGALFVAYSCAALAFLMPALSGWQRKNRLLLPCVLIIFATPFLFTSHFGDGGLFGMTLFVDPLLGILGGLAFHLACRKPFRSRFDTLYFCLVLLVLSVLKTTGLVFALFALGCALIASRREPSLRFLAPVLALAAGIGLWKLLLTGYGVTDLVALEPHLLDSEELSNLLRAMVSINVVGYKLPLGPLLSFAGVYTLLSSWFLFAALRYHRQEKKVQILCLVLMLASTTAFVYGYAVIYARTLESFPRYMATPLLCMAVFLLLRDIPLCRESARAGWLQKISPRLYKAGALLCVLGAVCVCVLWMALFPGYPQLEQADASAREIRQAVLRDDPAPEDARIYLVMAGDGFANARYHHRTYFSLISPEMNLRNALFKTQVVSAGLEDPAASWARELRDGFDYVYILTLEEDLIPVFEQLSQQAPRAGTLYRVTPSDNAYGVCLVSASR